MSFSKKLKEFQGLIRFKAGENGPWREYWADGGRAWRDVVQQLFGIDLQPCGANDSSQVELMKMLRWLCDQEVEEIAFDSSEVQLVE